MLGYDAPRWHAVLNDLPAAILLVAVLFDLASAWSKRESLRWAAIWTLWVGVIGGWAAVIAGELAEESINHGEAIHEIMERHEQMAIMTMAVFTIVLLWRMARRFVLPIQELALTRALSIAGIIGLIWTGVLGGKLMFEHAAGVKTETLQAEIRNREAGHHHEPGEEDDDHDHAVADSTKTPAHVDPPGTPPHKH
ncbi:MAG TPA: DUF2231 domain-containing protein [Burkholderiales bacterium]|jgi:uncharacterized membrane protein|nr:DUF2231 domain-containing protein [Burkholderiales bacterium]